MGERFHKRWFQLAVHFAQDLVGVWRWTRFAGSGEARMWPANNAAQIDALPVA
jgi:hypothetical protein